VRTANTWRREGAGGLPLERAGHLQHSPVASPRAMDGLADLLGEIVLQTHLGNQVKLLLDLIGMRFLILQDRVQ